MTQPLVSVETSHDDMIHDAQFDYYSTKLATCSSDHTIKVFDVKDDFYHNSATLTTHEGPVWQVAWAHPKFGVLLASCSYDGTVVVHKEGPSNTWSKVYIHKFAEASVNSIAWAPHEFGLVLACASSDGKVSVLEYKVEQWILREFQNDTLGCNSVSWAPYGAYDHANGSESGNGKDQAVMRLVTGSCDNTVRFWRYDETSGQWSEENKVGNPHSDWVRDVAWAPNTAMPCNIVASCSEDRSVCIWKENETGAWEFSVIKTFEAPVWRVSWSVTGNVLAVSSGDHQVTLYKQAVDGNWVQMSSASE
jgi:protein transport protein SEC13